MSAPLAPIPVRVTRYRCPSCNHRTSKKALTREHMRRCWWDPANRGCKTCANFEPNDCCGMADAYGCFTPMCPTGDSCAAGIDMAAEATGPGSLAVHCPSWLPKEVEA